MKTFVHLWQYLPKFFLEWLIFQTKVVEKVKTHILCAITFLRKSCHVWDNVEKCVRAGHATDDSIIRLCMLHNYGCRHTLRMCNTCFFPMSTVVTRTRLNVTLIRTWPRVHFTFLSYATETVSVTKQWRRNLPRHYGTLVCINDFQVFMSHVFGLNLVLGCGVRGGRLMLLLRAALCWWAGSSAWEFGATAHRRRLRPDQTSCTGRRNADTLGANWRCPPGLCGLSRSIRLFQNEVISVGLYAKWKNLAYSDRISILYCHCTVTRLGKPRSWWWA